MVTLEQASQLAAIVSAMADVYTVGRETFASYLRARQSDANYEAAGERLLVALGSYNDREVNRIKARIEGCRDRFIAEGGGSDRKDCLCSVLREVRDGNGGTLPDKGWQKTFEVLGCG